MKNINDYIKESREWWTGKSAQLISKKDLLKFAKEALKNTKLYPDDLQDELSQYEDPDDLDDAWANNKLSLYNKFEDELANIIFDDDKYSGNEGDICDHLWVYAWDLLNELNK